jgi:drug/metabolite transporter (DMT)-like permease
MTHQPKADATAWGMLVLLSIIWGGSFLFIGIAAKELPALLIVLARVSVAAAILLPVHLLFIGKLPSDKRSWIAFAGMALFNNVIPFTAISWGQHYLSSGLASVINATTPMFTVAVLALMGMDKITPLKVVGLIVGFVGVLVLKGGGFGDLGPQTLGIFAVVAASFSYGVSAMWAKLRLQGIAPLTIATCQLSISTAIMIPLSFAFSKPDQLFSVSKETAIALLLLAGVSTAIAYLIFFKIIARAGPTFVSLVTMLIPVSAIVMGYFWLGEKLSITEIVGAALILLALAVIDGRLFLWKSNQPAG